MSRHNNSSDGLQKCIDIIKKIFRNLCKFLGRIWRFALSPFNISSGLHLAAWLICIFYLPVILVLISIIDEYILIGLILRIIPNPIVGIEDIILQMPRMIAQMIVGIGWLRDAFASAIIPLVTAYSIAPSANKNIPRSLKKFVLLLIAILIVSCLTYAMLNISKDRLLTFSPLEISGNENMKVFDVLEQSISNYIKLAFTYISLTMGISWKQKS